MRSEKTSLSLNGVTNLAVMAPVRSGFVPVAETITYLDRLDRLLTALNAARAAAREATIGEQPFPDVIGRFRMIHGFRYAVFPPVPPEGPDPETRHFLTLNVTFDGGFEPYMRVIYSDLGPLLDALFSHADPANGYPMSVSHGFDTYCRWVRRNELGKGLYYADSGLTLADHRYLAKVERLQREGANPSVTDRRIAELALDAEPAELDRALLDAWGQRGRVAWHQLRALKGLHRLLPFFDCDGDRGVLWRFARSLLSDFRALLDGGFLDAPELAPLKVVFKDELDWLTGDPPAPLPAPRPGQERTFAPQSAQAGILRGIPGITHGALVLLSVADPALARGFLQAYPVTAQGAAPDDGVHRTLAFSARGLQALGLQPRWLDDLAPEFQEGMEARAGLLGDVRTHHPDHWRRPLRHDAPADAGDADRIELDTVHVVAALRLADAGTPGSELNPRLAPEVTRLGNEPTSGLRLLAVQPLRSWPEAGPDGSPHPREHFGFLDGFSQPHADPSTPPAAPRDQVPLGDLLLGFANGHEDPPFPERPHPLLDHGSYLVVRKLRQRVDRLNAVLEQQLGGGSSAAMQAAKVGILERMMGRGMDGRPLVPLPPGSPVTGNDFDYAADPKGEQCPFHSHVRRSNPRDGREAMPRLMRRGMSYGPRVTEPADLEAERGLVFMAYCASIAEQFEVVQRWIAGGNASGVASCQADPFLAVPTPGERRTWRIPDGAGGVRRLDLGDQPFVELEWGLYLFVPSVDALRELERLSQPLTEDPAPPARPLPADLEGWRALLDSPSQPVREAAWARVRAHPGGLDTAYGRLVGDFAGVLQALQDQDESLSVRGYGQRMAGSIGHGYLGLDGAAHDRLAVGVNAVLAGVTRGQAFAAARGAAQVVLQRVRQLALPEPGGAVKVAVDLIGFSEMVLGALCKLWFGLPDGLPDDLPDDRHMVLAGRKPGPHRPGDPVRCPGHLMMTSRYIFSNHPSPALEDEARSLGSAFRAKVADFLAATSEPRPGTLTDKLMHALPADATADERATTLAGVMLGFPPTVHGNFLRTIDSWLKSRRLWALQQALGPALKAHAADPAALWGALGDPLAKAVLGTMRERPLPETIWRLPADPKDDQPVVLGLASAMTDGAAPDELMFGGASGDTRHACPGYHMAVGVLCGMLAALLGAGQWRPTGSAVQLLLVTPGR